MVLLVLIQIVVYTWSLITWPFYFLIYHPWTKTSSFHRNRTERLDIENDQITLRALPKSRPKSKEKIIGDDIQTLDQLFQSAVDKHAKKNCIGTRRILEEKSEPGPNGKVFTKLAMESKYKWLNYQEVANKSTYIGR